MTVIFYTSTRASRLMPISPFPRHFINQPAVFISEAFAALIHRQLGAQHKSLPQNLGAGQELERFFRRGFGRNRHARRESHDTNVRFSDFLRDIAGKGSNPVFRYHVRRGATRCHAAATVEIDDVTGFSLRHMGDDVFDTEERAVKIGMHDPVPKLQRHIGDQRPARNLPGKVRHDGGVVHHHVDLAKAIDHFIDHRPDTVLVAHVGMHGQSLGRSANFRSRLPRQIVVEVSDDDFGFFPRESFRRVLADPLPAAGYDNHLAYKHGLPPEISYSYMQRISQSIHGFNAVMLDRSVILNDTCKKHRSWFPSASLRTSCSPRTVWSDRIEYLSVRPEHRRRAPREFSQVCRSACT